MAPSESLFEVLCLNSHGIGVLDARACSRGEVCGFRNKANGLEWTEKGRYSNKETGLTFATYRHGR